MERFLVTCNHGYRMNEYAVLGYVESEEQAEMMVKLLENESKINSKIINLIQKKTTLEELSFTAKICSGMSKEEKDAEKQKFINACESVKKSNPRYGVYCDRFIKYIKEQDRRTRLDLSNFRVDFRLDHTYEYEPVESLSGLLKGM